MSPLMPTLLMAAAAAIGPPGQLPPQVTGLRVFHRAGQTFITFQEVAPPLLAERPTWGEIKRALSREERAIRYRIYAHREPIDGKTIAAAELLSEIGPLTGYNANGRNVEYLIGQAMIEPDEIGELAKDYNGFIYSWHVDHPRMDRYPVPRLVIDEQAGPLPPGTGLYVHQPSAAGKRCYAVVCCRDGVENTRNFSPENALARPVEETVGPGEPVCQGDGLWGPYFDYPGRRKVYVQWCAPPLAPLPNMYFNWSVLVPPQINTPAPAEVYFHPAGYSYAQPGKKLLRNSIQLAPHDYPQSGWYGFHEAWQTLRPYPSGRVQPHTQRRIMAFLDWAKKALPIDADRILAVGGDGAALTAIHNPQAFACVLITGFDQSVLNPKAADRFAAVWGPKSDEIRDSSGRGAWSWAELDKLVLAAPGKDLPLLVCRGPSWGRVEGWGKGRGRFYAAMHQAGQPLVAHWAWGGKLIPPNKHTGLWNGLDITCRTPMPAFANGSLDQEGEGGGNTNTYLNWRDIVDQPERFEITITGRECTFDLTPRRMQQFRVAPGQTIRWEAAPLPGKAAKPGKTALEPQHGTVTADRNGVVTLRGLKLAGEGITVTLIRAK